MSFTSLWKSAHRLGTLSLWCGWAFVQTASAQVYNGPGPLSGAQATLPALAGLSASTNPRSAIIAILQSVLTFVSLAAVTAVIIAGIYLIVGLGSDDSKEKAKKIIQYTLIGLMIILFSEVIVGLVTNYLANQI